MRDNLARVTEMSEEMERRHRQELQELRESYEGCDLMFIKYLLDRSVAEKCDSL